jgi:hypothetical protein
MHTATKLIVRYVPYLTGRSMLRKKSTSALVSSSTDVRSVLCARARVCVSQSTTAVRVCDHAPLDRLALALHLLLRVGGDREQTETRPPKLCGRRGVSVIDAHSETSQQTTHASLACRAPNDRHRRADEELASGDGYRLRVRVNDHRRSQMSPSQDHRNDTDRTLRHTAHALLAANNCTQASVNACAHNAHIPRTSASDGTSDELSTAVLSIDLSDSKCTRLYAIRSLTSHHTHTNPQTYVHTPSVMPADMPSNIALR